MRFYFTVHPSDLSRARLPHGVSIMLVASSVWDGRRLRVRRPPQGHIATWCLDSGGFTAAKKWGRYPWTISQYVEWAQRCADRHPLDFLAALDFCCERGVDRTVYATNQERILATIENARRCFDAAPALPWLLVVQGGTVEEYASCVERYQALGLCQPYMGLGTMCGRPWQEGQRVLVQLALWFPGIRWHVFGADMRMLDDDLAASVVESWDSYAWTWGKGAKGDACRLQRRPGETRSSYYQRLAAAYGVSVNRRIQAARTLPLFSTPSTSTAGGVYR